MSDSIIAGRRGLLFGGAAALGASAMGGLARAMPTGPVIGPLPDTPTKGLLVWDVSPGGYIAEEYIVSGTADTYETVSAVDAYDAATRDYGVDQSNRNFNRPVVKAAQPYVHRVIVYRPADPKRFSGNVIVEPLHPLGGGGPNALGRIGKFFMDHGDVQVSVHMPAQLDALKDADPARYGKLTWSHPTQLWGMLADTARLVHSGALLHGLKARRLYMTGYSHTGVMTAVFLNYHHDTARRADGGPLYDGYVSMAGAVYTKPIDVPVIRLNTQGDFDSYGALARRSPDSDEKGRQHRHYELAGASHGSTALPQEGQPKRPARSLPPPKGTPSVPGADCQSQFPAGSANNDYPLRVPIAAMFQNLYAWVDKGVPPPRAPRLETDAAGVLKLDENGNALGGLRLPTVTVPIARYGVGQGNLCRLTGYKLAFDDDRKRALYGTHAAYVAKVQAEADRLLAARFILPGGAAELVAAAKASPTF